MKRSNRGFASIEAMVMMVIFVVLIGYGLGMFGIIHTGILHSISARAYAWETFRHRTNLTYFRDIGSRLSHYKNFGFRTHGIISETDTRAFWLATERNLAIGLPLNEIGRNSGAHAALDQFTRRNSRTSVSPVWIKVLYGICLDSNCGGVQP